MIYQESKQSNGELTKKKKPLKHSPSKQGKLFRILVSGLILLEFLVLHLMAL